MELDDALHLIGDHGRGQILLFVIISGIGQIPAAWHIFAIIFLGAAPDHQCSTSTVSDVLKNLTENAVASNNCENNSSDITSYCKNGWMYSSDMYGSTIVSQWDLVCDRERLVAFSQSVMIMGVTIGSFTVGYFADRFGRKPIFFVGLFLLGIVGSIQALSPSFTFFIVVRFVVGIVQQYCEIPVYAIISELFTPRHRPIALISMINFWATGILTLPLIAYFIRDWRYLQLAISIPCLFCPLLYWIIPESPRWLLSVGRYGEASAIVNRLAKVNGKKDINITFTSPHSERTDKTESHKLNDIVTMYDSEGDEENSSMILEGKSDPDGSCIQPDGEISVYLKGDFPQKNAETINHETTGGTAYISSSYFHLFRGYRIFMVTTVLSLTSCMVSFSYYGVSLSAGRLAGNPYLNVFLSGAVEIPSHIVAAAIVVWFGRRWSMCVFLFMTGISLVVVAFLPEISESGVDLTAVIVSLAMTGKFSIAAAYAIVCLCAAEIFPTLVRSKGIGFCAMSSRAGAYLAPVVITLQNTMPMAPMLMFGTATIIPGMLILLLPEMKGRIQPQTISDLENLFVKDKPNKTTDSCISDRA